MAVPDWLTKLAPLSQPMRSKTKTDRALLARVFPRLAPVSCIWALIGSLCCLCLLGLARVITLVLVVFVDEIVLFCNYRERILRLEHENKKLKEQRQGEQEEQVVETNRHLSWR